MSKQVWRSVGLSKRELDLKILGGGQSFRWVQLDGFVWRSTMAGVVVDLKQNETEIFYQNYNVKTSTWEADPQLQPILEDYFNIDINLLSLHKTWGEVDQVFLKAANVHTGVRILRQDPVENLFSFICSSCNNIPRITSMVEKLCIFYGDKVATIDGKDYHSFPSVAKLAGKGVEEKLREEAFGYRAKYIHQTALKLLEDNGEAKLNQLRNEDFPKAKSFLLQFPGVGPKVADCVCLMSLDKHSAIPVDTHVWQYAVRDYGFRGQATKSMSKKLYEEIGDHFRNLHGPYAGWAQSVLFLADLRQFKQEGEEADSAPSSSKKRKPETETTGKARKK